MASELTWKKWHLAVASRIRTLRKAAGMTQEQLSEKAGIAPQHLSRLETARQVPSLDTIADLAEALGTTPSFLVGNARLDEQEGRLRRLEKMLAMLSEEDASFLEARLVSWISHLKKRSQ